MPALEAAKCAQLQGEEAATRFHQLVMAAYFEEGLDISDPQVLLQVARKADLNLRKFRKDLKSGSQRQEVLKEFQEGQRLGIAGIPTAILTDQKGSVKVIGEVPSSSYRRLVSWFAST